MNIIVNKLKICVLGVFVFISTAIFAQNGTIKGTIIDAKTKEPLIGASVLVTGTTQGAAADLDGNYAISNVSAGTHTLEVSYVAYKSIIRTGVIVQSGREIVVDFNMDSDDYALQEVEVVAKANRESENILLLEQKKALIATQAVGARELSRKGISNAEAAVAQVSGISRQEGVKNVFVRGLGDRYNSTLLNGMPIPSEDPEYKNIALEFFGTDVIQNIGVNKVFSGRNSGDVGGAIIDISSKELVSDQSLAIDLAAGLNAQAPKTNFLRQDGVNYFGFANAKQPAGDVFDFANSLDPSQAGFPLNHSYGLSGGKRLLLGDNRNPLSFFVVGSHSTSYSYTDEIVKNANTAGTIWQDQQGKRYSQNINQLLLGNVNFGLNRKHQLSYNFMMIHANDQYVGEYVGMNGERHQDSENYMGFLRRQQTNDNLLLTHQLISDWKLSNSMNLNVGASYNSIKGLEPDRRENYLSKMTDGSYSLTGSNRQKRFFSTLNENDFNIRASLNYKLRDGFSSENSSVEAGYIGRFVNDDFIATEYNFSAVSGALSIENLKLDNAYNAANLAAGKFKMTVGDPNSYKVSKQIHSAYLDVNYQLAAKLLANAGVRADKVDLTVNYVTQNAGIGSESIHKMYFLPTLNLKYDLDNKNVFRLGASKTYTLPQSKEISPYQYVSIGFASQGNPKIKPSDNYNLDLKWDYYLTPSELISVTGFFKHIVNPIGRADQGNSAGLLEYTNISDKATVAGVEVEVRKNIFSLANADQSKINRLSFGVNASYIYSNLTVKLNNTPERSAQLEGAAPFLANFDISYNYIQGNRSFINSFVVSYFSSRVHTIGTQGFKDIIEKSVPTLDFVSTAKLNKNLTLKLKAANLLNPNYQLSREISTSNETIVLNQYKKGMNVSLGINYEF